jgi:hypothetical protein
VGTAKEVIHRINIGVLYGQNCLLSHAGSPRLPAFGKLMAALQSGIIKVNFVAWA